MAHASNLTELLHRAFATIAEGTCNAGCKPPSSVTFEVRLDALGTDIAEGPHSVARFEVEVPREAGTDGEGIDLDGPAPPAVAEDGMDGADLSTDLSTDPSAEAEDEDEDEDEDELDRLTRP